jgi:hypothetical protein
MNQSQHHVLRTSSGDVWEIWLNQTSGETDYKFRPIKPPSSKLEIRRMWRKSEALRKA